VGRDRIVECHQAGAGHVRQQRGREHLRDRSDLEERRGAVRQPARVGGEGLGPVPHPDGEPGAAGPDCAYDGFQAIAVHV
jgi:hypothetical protein